jgi:hypothetical protein
MNPIHTHPHKIVLLAINSRTIKRTMHVTIKREIRNAYRVLVAKSEGNRVLARHRYKREDNIKTDLKYIKYGRMD